MKITDKDLKIIEELQKNSKIPIKEIAKNLKTPMTTVYDRIKKMEKYGVIKKYTTIVDNSKLNKPAVALVFITVRERGDKNTVHTIRKVAQKLSKFDRILEVYVILGQYDIVLKVVGKSMAEIGGFIIDNIRTVRGVDKTWTNALIQPVKEYGIVK